MKSNIDLLIGPYVGDWEQEVMTFRPYARWLQEAIGGDNKVYISAHVNRRFLYNWIDDDMFIPIYENLSRDEDQQYKNIHHGLNIKDFNMLTKHIKAKLLEAQDTKRKVKTYTFNYTVNSIANCPIYNKLFERIKVDSEERNNIVFIPDNRETEECINAVYEHLINKYDNVLVIGDTNTYLKDMNPVLDCIDYFENGYIYIMEYINSAKAIICPASHWTAIANMQGIPVFSWGNAVGPYRHDGVYNFNNNKYMAIATDENTPVNIITNMIDYFIEKLEGGNC